MPASAEAPAIRIFCSTCGKFLLEMQPVSEARIRSLCNRCGMDVVITCYTDPGEGKNKPRLLVSIPVPKAA